MGEHDSVAAAVYEHERNNPDHVIYNLNIDAGSMWARKLIDRMVGEEQAQRIAAE